MSRPSSGISSASPHLPVRPDWLAQVVEAPIDPDLPIIDAHHHLWDRPGNRYLFDEYRQDIDHAGHAVLASVYVQCRSMFDADRDGAWASVGEVEFANGVAAMSASGLYGKARLCAAIVCGADLRQGDFITPVLEQMRERAGARLRGVRNTTAWHADPRVVTNPNPPPAGVLREKGFRTAVGRLREFELALDIWGYHTQLDDMLDLARSFPDQLIVIDHVAGPLGTGPYEGRRGEVLEHWKRGIALLAQCPNVRIKLGGLGMSVSGFALHTQPLPPDSARLAQLWRPYLMHCIEQFGVERCMFESNFPVDKGMYGYCVMWNAFKRVTADFSPDERDWLFNGTAAQTYGITLSG
ncbi:amidohydrolase family protein [Pseudomonas sp. JDS28PS106]|uniref:amidohydrolase family protein n=1 Tax=Pseudomonas sp. JDS28PS106 TaxID=2497235 RepID=UPI002FCF5B96